MNKTTLTLYGTTPEYNYYTTPEGTLIEENKATGQHKMQLYKYNSQGQLTSVSWELIN